MRNMIELDSVAAVEEVARRIVIPGTSIVTSRRGYAGNDATYENPAKEAEAWARHALAANGFGDSAVAESEPGIFVPPARPASYDLYLAARAYRSYSLGEIIVATMQAVAAIARQAFARHAQRQQAKSTYDALRQLDDHTLRDLGFHRSEIR